MDNETIVSTDKSDDIPSEITSCDTAVCHLLSLEDMSILITKLEDAVSAQIASIPDSSNDISNISGRLQGLTSYIEENSKRLRRLEEGYDFQILKSFAKQIIREIRSLRKKAAGLQEDSKIIIEDAVDSLVELLDRNSITQITLETGAYYAGQEKVAECAAQKCFTEDESLNGRIASIVNEGYQYEFNDGSSRVIEPAKVILFSNNREYRSENAHADLAMAESVKEKLKTFETMERYQPGTEILRLLKLILRNRNFIFYFVIAVLSCCIFVLGGVISWQHKELNANNDTLRLLSEKSQQQHLDTGSESYPATTNLFISTTSNCAETTSESMTSKSNNTSSISNSKTLKVNKGKESL